MVGSRPNVAVGSDQGENQARNGWGGCGYESGTPVPGLTCPLGPNRIMPVKELA